MLDDPAAHATALALGVDPDRANLGEGWGIEPEGAASDHLVVLGRDREITDGLEDLLFASRKILPSVRPEIDQPFDVCEIRDSCGPNCDRADRAGFRRWGSKSCDAEGDLFRGSASDGGSLSECGIHRQVDEDLLIGGRSVSLDISQA